MAELPDPLPRTSSDGVEGRSELQMCGSPDELVLVAEGGEAAGRDRGDGG